MADLTQEQIRSLRAWSEHPTTLIQKDDLAAALHALLAAYEERGREVERLTIVERAGADAGTDLEAQLGEAEAKLHDAESENIGLSARAINAEARLADAHCLLQEAAAAVDPETWPELSAKLADALECGLPQCKHAQEAFEARDKAEAREAKLREALRALREEAKAMHIPEAIPEGHKERVLVLRAHISDVAALAASPEPAPPEEKP